MRAEGEVYRGRRVVWPVGAALVSLATVAFVATLPALTTAGFFLVLIVLTAVSFAALAHLARWGAGRRRAVGVDARGLSIDGQLALPRRAISGAHVVDDPDGRYTVVVEPRGLRQRHLIRVDSARIAQALADTLSIEQDEVAEFHALPPWAHRMRWLAMVLTTSSWAVFNLLRHLPSFAVIIVLVLYASLAVPVFLAQSVAIGQDGILLRWAGRRRFIPYGSLRSARATSLGIELELESRDDDASLEIRLTHRDGAQATRSQAILDRIQRAMTAHRALGRSEDEALLARGTRNVETWLRDMTELGRSEGGCGYRAIAVPRDRLWAVLENPATHPSAREGAALALNARLDEQERERLAAIAQKTAAPRLRVAIDTMTLSPERLRVALLDMDRLDEADHVEHVADREAE